MVLLLAYFDRGGNSGQRSAATPHTGHPKGKANAPRKRSREFGSQTVGTTSSGSLADRTQTAVRLSRPPSLQREDLLLRVVQLLLRAVQHLLRLRQLDLQRADGPVFGRDGLTNTLLHVR